MKDRECYQCDRKEPHSHLLDVKILPPMTPEQVREIHDDCKKQWIQDEEIEKESIMKQSEYEKIVCPDCDGSGYVHAYEDGRVIPSCCDGDGDKRQKLKERIIDIIDKALQYSDCDRVRSEDVAERILKEIEK